MKMPRPEDCVVVPEPVGIKELHDIAVTRLQYAIAAPGPASREQVGRGCNAGILVAYEYADRAVHEVRLRFTERGCGYGSGTLGGNTTVINPPNLGSFADRWARFLYATDVSSAVGQQNVITYGISVYKDAPDASENALLTSMAKQGHGRYFTATNLGEITTALQTIFDEMRAVDSVFASVTLPVSVNVRGTNLNQVYLGVFRPDADSKPRWYGNLKQYKIGKDRQAGGDQMRH